MALSAHNDSAGSPRRLPGERFVHLSMRSCGFSPVFVHNSRHINQRGMNEGERRDPASLCSGAENDQPIFKRNDRA